MRDLLLIMEATTRLWMHDRFMQRHTFKQLYQRIKDARLLRQLETVSLERISASLEIATALYWKEVLCLQRSAVLVSLCRRYGIDAHMVTGVQRMPFKAHAWVEVDGAVVNDPVASREQFLVMEVC